jgi:chromosome segregation ATPase
VKIKLDDSSKENTYLKSEVSLLTKKLSSTEGLINSLETSNKELSNTVSTLKVSRTDLTTKIVNFESEMQNLRNLNKSLQASLETSKDSIRLGDLSTQEYLNKAKILENKEADLTKKIAQLESNLADSRSEHQSVVGGKKALEAKLSETERASTKFQEQYEEVLKKMDALQSKEESHASNLMRAEEDNIFLKKDIAALQESVRVLESGLRACEEAKAALTNKVGAMEASERVLSDQLRGLLLSGGEERLRARIGELQEARCGGGGACGRRGRASCRV